MQADFQQESSIASDIVLQFLPLGDEPQGE